jgi:hypothetical protein
MKRRRKRTFVGCADLVVVIDEARSVLAQYPLQRQDVSWSLVYDQTSFGRRGS